jgi:hypothetical protein
VDQEITFTEMMDQFGWTADDMAVAALTMRLVSHSLSKVADGAVSRWLELQAEEVEALHTKTEQKTKRAMSEAQNVVKFPS